jgi:hypothetical protein
MKTLYGDRLIIEKGEMFAPLPHTFNEHYHRGTAMEKLCECGCGEAVKLGNRFIHGHTNRGKSFSEDHKRKLSESNRGQTRSEETCVNISKSTKGKSLSKGHKAKLSAIGKGKIISKKTREKLSIALKGKKKSSEHILNSAIGHMKCRTDGYCDVWSDQEYREDLRGGTCEVCGITNMLSIHISGCKLHIHHKNGKKECAPEDVSTLCNSCHLKIENEMKRAA